MNSGFVRAKDRDFVLGDSDQPFKFIGGNSYHLLKYSIVPETRPLVQRLLDFYAENSMTVLRTWAFWDGPEDGALQRAPGVFDERSFCALDFVLHEASLRNIKLLLVLTNYWKDFGGMQQYLKWSKGDGEWPSELFYQDPKCFDFYIEYIRAVLSRRNTLSGVLYKDDPTVFAWSIANEPRFMGSTSAAPLQDWLCSVGVLVKAMDSNHMVTFGSEGFFGPSTPDFIQWNPYDTCDHGVDFLMHSRIECFDFCCFHLWPDNWGLPSEEDKITFAKQWITNTHCLVATKQLNKPLILSEFGKRKSHRLSYFSEVIPEIEDVISKGMLCGALVWHLVTSEYPDYDGNSIHIPKDSSEPQSPDLYLLTQCAKALSPTE